MKMSKSNFVRCIGVWQDETDGNCWIISKDHIDLSDGSAIETTTLDSYPAEESEATVIAEAKKIGENRNLPVYRTGSSKPTLIADAPRGYGCE